MKSSANLGRSQSSTGSARRFTLPLGIEELPPAASRQKAACSVTSYIPWAKLAAQRFASLLQVRHHKTTHRTLPPAKVWPKDGAGIIAVPQVAGWQNCRSYRTPTSRNIFKRHVKPLAKGLPIERTGLSTIN